MKWTHTADLSATINKYPPGTTVLLDDPGCDPATIKLPDGTLSWAHRSEMENLKCLYSRNTQTKSA